MLSTAQLRVCVCVCVCVGSCSYFALVAVSAVFVVFAVFVRGGTMGSRRGREFTRRDAAALDEEWMANGLARRASGVCTGWVACGAHGRC